MRVIIIGAGEVGLNLAEKLSSENHEVVVIEKDEDKINKVSDSINALFIHGSGSSVDVLKEAGIENCEIFIAATNFDEVNLISCFIASKYKIPHVIARLNKEELPEENYKQLGLTKIINTNTVVAKEIFNLIQYEGAQEFIQFEKGKVLLFGIIIDKKSPFLNKSLIELNQYRQKIPFLIVCIQREEQVIIPKGYDKIQENDHILIITIGDYLPLIKRLFLKKTRKYQKKIFILGAGKIGIELTKQLEKVKNYNVIIADKDYDTCLYLNEILEKSLILNIDGLDIPTLETELLTDVDVFVAATKNDEINIISSTIMKRLGAKKTIAIIRKSGFAQFMDDFKIDLILSPRLITASNILQYTRKGEVIKAVPIFEELAEIIEFKITKNNKKLINKALSELDFPQETIVGAIIREDKAIIPSGTTILKENDKLVIFTKSKNILELQNIIQ